MLEFVRRDALAAIIPAFPIPAAPDLKALPAGRREHGLPWCVRLHGTHILVAGGRRRHGHQGFRGSRDSGTLR